MRLLPKWCITDKHPAFYDMESATAIEQTAKLYGAMRELIEDYNKFVDEINAAWTEYKTEGAEDYDVFQRKMEQLYSDFVKVIEMKYQSQDMAIQDAVTKIISELPAQLETMINEMYQSGEFDNIVYRSIENLKNDFDKIVNNTNKFQQTINSSFTNTLNDIEALKSQINTDFTDLENEFNQKFDDLQVNSGLADMQKVVYDTNDNGVVDDSEKLGGRLPEYYAKQQDLDSTNLNIETMETTMSGVRNQLTTVQNTANTAKTIAEQAKANNTEITTKVDNAITLANAAQTTADNAKSTADNAMAAANNSVKKSGDTMTGALTLNGDPTANLHAATKQYVDSKSGMVSLWTNSNLTSAYNGQTIKPGFTRNDYSLFIVCFKLSVTSNTRHNIIVKPNGYAHDVQHLSDIPNDITGYINRRSVLFNSSNEVVFGDAMKKIIGETTAETDNKLLIPVEIIGIK